VPRAATGPLELVQGLRAGLAVFARRPDDVVRVGYARSVRRDVAPLVRWAASSGVPCSELSDRELDAFSQSSHHEGLCLACRPRAWASVQAVADLLVRSSGTAIAFDRVRNPYNIGAIIRSAAFFGVQAVLVGAAAPEPDLAPTAVRVAEGGAEAVTFARTTDLAMTLARLRSKGVSVIGADGRAKTAAFGFAFRRPALLVVGHEREGLTERVRVECETLVAIGGSGHVDSLNVSVAAGVLIAEMMRRSAQVG
jgi:TrmH RNA methyltransferase